MPLESGGIKLVVSKVLNNAVADDLIAKSPAIALDLPDAPAKVLERTALSQEQALNLMRVCGEVAPRFEAYVTLGVTSGLRPTELRGLQWGDIAMLDSSAAPLPSSRWARAESASVTIERQLVQEGTAFRCKGPKSARSRRTIVIHSMAMRALLAHRRNWNAERLEKGVYLPAEWEQLVFTTTAGRPLDNANTRRMLRRVCSATIPTDAMRDRAELGEFIDVGIRSSEDLMRVAISKPVTPYDLRHTAATLLLADGRGMSLIQCADYLGHSPQMLEQVYRHAPEVRGTNFDPFSDAAGIAERVDAALPNRRGKQSPGAGDRFQL